MTSILIGYKLSPRTSSHSTFSTTGHPELSHTLASQPATLTHDRRGDSLMMNDFTKHPLASARVCKLNIGSCLPCGGPSSSTALFHPNAFTSLNARAS